MRTAVLISIAVARFLAFFSTLSNGITWCVLSGSESFTEASESHSRRHMSGLFLFVANGTSFTALPLLVEPFSCRWTFGLLPCGAVRTVSV